MFELLLRHQRQKIARKSIQFGEGDFSDNERRSDVRVDRDCNPQGRRLADILELDERNDGCGFFTAATVSQFKVDCDPSSQISFGRLGSFLESRFGRIRSAASLNRTLLSVNGSFFRPKGSADRDQESERGENGTDDSNPEGYVSGILGGIRRFPLGAKIAGTVVIATTALLVMGRGVFALLEGRGNILKGSGYLLIGIAGWLSSAVFWIGG
jgi:hypothetical protein